MQSSTRPQELWQILATTRTESVDRLKSPTRDLEPRRAARLSGPGPPSFVLGQILLLTWRCVDWSFVRQDTDSTSWRSMARQGRAARNRPYGDA
ncbi:hypothetical protein VFPBJ_01527 [Purpureocillium lilacinum]|uniref:Uncharacterized protein n=1 Tax=Purpureocillium lilacinum TaxID=33203 RepID=A0A179HBB4_PURLI|nr:hypothetical protein VFPBJ_01527 [Purpureocillium lilacinum]